MAGNQNSDSIYFYNPSLPASIIFTALYTILAAVLTYQTIFKFKAWYLLCLPAGALLEAVGYMVRDYSVKHTSDVVSAIATSSAPTREILLRTGFICCISLTDCHCAALHRRCQLPSRRAHHAGGPASSAPECLQTPRNQHYQDICRD
jgi:hypothetical protein